MYLKWYRNKKSSYKAKSSLEKISAIYSMGGNMPHYKKYSRNDGGMIPPQSTVSNNFM